jgi:hypothetical protein
MADKNNYMTVTSLETLRIRREQLKRDILRDKNSIEKSFNRLRNQDAHPSKKDLLMGLMDNGVLMFDLSFAAFKLWRRFRRRR